MLKSLLLITSMTLSTSFIFTTHPLIMGCMLMLQTLIACLMINFIQKSNWIAFIVFLLIMGNMLILFLYVVSLAANEIMKPNYPPMMKLMIMTGTAAMLISNSWIMKIPNENFHNSSNTQLSVEESILLAKLFHQSMMTIIMILMLLLFFNLCSTISIITLHEGPMRTMN
uniref:NADH dehydrogenase subunit 6 n=1 Tax=Hemiodoecus leai TaxID=1254501 RepID=A0A0U1XEH7_9HEMI|nr:NADH dehydrogenase subunit 6 [Hemiodoecus leai]AIS38313.1 NADH dehydrogenase subunit 6 [Hemiodoecus leai]